jgi:hypothetical protein
MNSKHHPMKNNILLWCFLTMAASLFITSCDDDDSINTNISPVKSLFAPADNLFVKLAPTTEASVVFEWEQSKAEDGTLVLYEVVFDKESGDFSSPVYKLVSDSKGLENSLTLSHKDLNKIANFAGIPSLGTGKLKWTVLASKGINVLQAEAARNIEVERPAGFAEIPADLYITGDATEAGTDLANAIKFKQTASGVFELYTSLSAGSYQLVDRLTATHKTFSIDGSQIKQDGSTTVTGDKVYRLRLDFNNAAANVVEVTKVELWFAPDGAFWFDLPYTGNSVWEATDKSIVFKQEGWGRDERYKFRFTFNDGGVEKYEWFGSSNSDNQRPTSTSPLAYWFMFPVNDSRWDYCFKFDGAVDNKTADVRVIFSPTASYTHEVIGN